jgi:hypothetical protein
MSVDYKEVAQELNLLIQNYLLGKFGAETEFAAQYNEEHVYVWVKFPKEAANIQPAKGDMQ